MKNLEQIRAANALKASPDIEGGKEGGRNIAKKIPTYIRNNGILGAAAYAREVGEGYGSVMLAVIDHLSSEGIRMVQSKQLDSFIDEISGADSIKLRHVTDEAMAYLNYLRRFAE